MTANLKAVALLTNAGLRHLVNDAHGYTILQQRNSKSETRGSSTSLQGGMSNSQSLDDDSVDPHDEN